jgi:hypothetical protein
VGTQFLFRTPEHLDDGTTNHFFVRRYLHGHLQHHPKVSICQYGPSLSLHDGTGASQHGAKSCTTQQFVAMKSGILAKG